MVGIRDAIRGMTGQYKDAVVGRVYEKLLKEGEPSQNPTTPPERPL